MANLHVNVSKSASIRLGELTFRTRQWFVVALLWVVPQKANGKHKNGTDDAKGNARDEERKHSLGG